MSVYLYEVGVALPFLLTGWLWQSYGAATALLTGAGLAAVAAAALLLVVEETEPGHVPGR